MRLFILIFLLLSQLLFAQIIKVNSPDSLLQLIFVLEEGSPTYQINRMGIPVINPSGLGFIFKDTAPMISEFEIDSSKISTFDETWTQPWGEKKDIRNNYNELKINLIEKNNLLRQFNIIFRVYDDGIGLRYEFPEQENMDYAQIQNEITEFALNGDHNAWWIKAYQWNRYEYLYTQSLLSKIDTVHTPLTMETQDKLYLSIHEAALTDYASMTLANKGNNTLEADLVPWSDGIKVKTTLPFRTPWRTIQIADTPGGLITSYIILNLNEPNRLKDISWIKPAKYVGIWWELHLDLTTWGSGKRHGATNENTIRYIDFAAQNGFDAVLIEGSGK